MQDKPEDENPPSNLSQNKISAGMRTSGDSFAVGSLCLARLGELLYYGIFEMYCSKECIDKVVKNILHPGNIIGTGIKEIQGE
jgi:hypothetical protein